MRKQVYEAYINALKGNKFEASKITQQTKEDPDLVLTVKAYKEAKGLSQKIANTHLTKLGNQFKVMGPMGKGLRPK